MNHNYTEFGFVILIFLDTITMTSAPQQCYKDPIPLVFTAFLGIGLKIRETDLSDSGAAKYRICLRLQFTVGDFRGG